MKVSKVVLLALLFCFSYKTTLTTAQNNAKTSSPFTVDGNGNVNAANVILGPINPTVSIPSSSLIASGSGQSTTIADSSSTTTVFDLASVIDFKVGQGICVVGAGPVSAVSHCPSSTTSDCVRSIQSINTSTNQITVSSACASAPANGVAVYHDDTAAFVAAASGLSTTNHVKLILPPGLYHLNAAQANVNQGLFASAQTALFPVPTIDVPINGRGGHAFTTLEIDCVTPASFNVSASYTGGSMNQGGCVFDTAAQNGNMFYGAGSCTGGLPNCSSTTSYFTAVNLVLKNLTLRATASPSSHGPNVIMVNACGIEQFALDHVIIDTGLDPGITVATNTNGIGVIGGCQANWGNTILRDSQVQGYYIGAYLGGDVYLDNFTVFQNNIGIGVNTTVGDGHQMTASHILSFYNQYQIVAEATNDPLFTTLFGNGGCTAPAQPSCGTYPHYVGGVDPDFETTS